VRATTQSHGDAHPPEQSCEARVVANRIPDRSVLVKERDHPCFQAAFQPRERGLGFFNSDRQGKRVTRRCLTEIADQFQYWLKNRTEKWGVPLLDAPEGGDDESRRNKFVEQYFQDAKPNQVVAILKAREPARILVAIGDKDNDSPHLEYKQRWVNQYNFYVNDPHWGRM